MHWPPSKAWTSVQAIKGFRHFVAINYGGKGIDRWVNLVSVLDGDVNLRVEWSTLKNKSIWSSGWKQIDLTKNEHSDINVLDQKQEQELLESSCFHLSSDSGFLDNNVESNVRSWWEIGEKN